MKRFTLLIISGLASLICFSQPKNIILVMADGMGFNHANIVTSNSSSIFNSFDYNFASCNYPSYWSSLDAEKNVANYRGDYHVRRIWQEFSYADSLPMNAITAGSALATGIKPAYNAVSTDLDSTTLETIIERAKINGKRTALITDGDLFEDNALYPFACHKVVANDYDDLFFELLTSSSVDVVATQSEIYEISHPSWTLVTDTQNIPSDISKHILISTQNPSQELVSPIYNLLSNEQGFVAITEFTQVARAAEKRDVAATILAMENLETYIREVSKWIETNSSWDETLLIVVGSYEQGYLTSKSFNKETPVANYLSTNSIDIQYNSDYPTNLLTPVYAKGCGSYLLQHYTDETDFLLGSYVSNTEISQMIFRLLTPKPQTPKNIILMINDGCGISPIKMADYYTGKTASFEQFPVQLFNCTHPTATNSTTKFLDSWNNTYESRLAWTGKDYLWARKNATCSGASGTALATGKKTYYYCLGVDVDRNALRSIARFAKDSLHKAAGVATNAPYNDATPGAFFTNNPDRLESGALSRQVIIESNADVVIGCNHPEYDNNAQKLEEPDYSDFGGVEMLTGLRESATEYAVASNSGWTTVRDIDDDGEPDAWTFVEDSAGLAQYISGETPKRLFAVMPVQGSMQFYRTGTNTQEVHFDDWNPHMPQLWQIGRTAINCLSKNENGFFVMIEGDMVDNAGHKNQLGRHIEEQIEFNRAVDSVIAWIETNSSWDETLLIVTADHETGFVADETFGEDSILLNHWQIGDNGVGQLPSLKYYSTDHSNQLVPFFAKGAGSEIFERYADDCDYVFGKYLNNSEVGQSMFELWDGMAGQYVNKKPVVTYFDTITLTNRTDFSIELPHNIIEDEEDEIEIKLKSKPSWVKFDKETFTLYGTTPAAIGMYYVNFQTTDGSTTGAALTTLAEVKIQVIRKSVTAIPDEQETDIQIFPNPAITDITITTEGHSGTIIVRDMMGKIVYRTTISNRQTTIPVEQLNAGEYEVQIIENDHVTTKKIITY